MKSKNAKTMKKSMIMIFTKRIYRHMSILLVLVQKWLLAEELGAAPSGLFVRMDTTKLIRVISSYIPSSRAFGQLRVPIIIFKVWFEPLATNTDKKARVMKQLNFGFGFGLGSYFLSCSRISRSQSNEVAPLQDFPDGQPDFTNFL